MQEPSIPQNEAERLQALRRLNILDTESEERFDRLTRLARRLFNVPIALVSLVDQDRQWFKSRAGLDAEETPRSISFCGHAILGDEVLQVPDALQDQRFHDNPLVQEDPHIRFYAGAPLAAPCGRKLGTLCLIGREPKELDSEEETMLRDLACIAEKEISSIELAHMDDLTQLTNRRGFRVLATHALHMCVRMNRPAALYYFDLDQFKPINDQFGHAEGDRALQTFGKLLQETFRDSDVVGRLGGDEFAVLLTGSALNDCEGTLERFGEALERHNDAGSLDYRIQFTVGGIEFDHRRHSGIGDLVEDADLAMLSQKSGQSRASSQDAGNGDHQ